jgi:8-oxo-dGTP pyrophosphatase MutT (NUDIX family)
MMNSKEQENKDDRKWTILSSEYLIRRPWLTARRDHVKLPTGAELPEYYVLEYPDWINVIAITEDEQFVLVRQYRHALGRTCYELCAGVCEKDEEPIESAKRELLEETGFGGGDWQELMATSANASTMTNLTHSFLATGVKKISEQHLDDGEDLSVHILSKNEVRAMLERGEFVQSLMLAPLWKYFAKES